MKRIFALLFVAPAVIVLAAILAGCRLSQPKQLPDALSSYLPYDVDVNKIKNLIGDKSVDAVAKQNLLDAHREFALLAWQAFIALNWPADSDGKPSQTQDISDVSANRVWDFWRPADTIFLPEGNEPNRWDGKLQNTHRFQWKSAWRQHTTAGSNTEAFGGPLVDQNGNWVRFQMRVNREEFDYIYDNGLYSVDKQIEFSQKPENNQVELPLNQGTSTHGAIEIKLAWKELGPGDDPRRFFTRQLTADVSEPPGPDGKPAPPRYIKQAGLVGMHIAMRTQSSPEWIWATFEQIDNVPDPDRPPFHPSFNNPNDTTTPLNALPVPNAVQDPDTGAYTLANPPTADRWVEHLTRTPVQLVRVPVATQPGLNPHDADLDAVAREVNRQVQKLLHDDHDSVFQYYKLIDVQWPVQPNAPAAAGGAGSAPESIAYKTPGQMVPVFLINTTMETYFQHGPQPAGALEQDDRLSNAPPIDATTVAGTESCVGCHYSSGIATAYKKDLCTGKIVVDGKGYPIIVAGENNHFGKTGNASFSWMLQLEPKGKPREVHDANVIVSPSPPPPPNYCQVTGTGSDKKCTYNPTPPPPSPPCQVATK
jgi:hypothetical protein